MTSILTTIKKMLGIVEECEDFDVDILANINAALFVMYQVGAISEPLSVSGNSTAWSDLQCDAASIPLVEQYVYLKTKIGFDSASLSSATMDSINKQILEYEWRLNVSNDN